MRKDKQPNLAVALEYDEATKQAPRVTAKGRGAAAEKILEIAQENGIVVESDPHLAEALSGVELDETIPIELYQAVAEVLGFVLRTSAKRRS